MVLTLTIIICGLLLGEAVTLLAGSYFISEKTLPWLTRKNAILLILDIILASLIIIAFPALNYLPVFVYYSSLILVIGSLLFRTREYIFQTESKFCENKALYIINNILLAALLVVLILSVVS